MNQDHNEIPFHNKNFTERRSTEILKVWSY